MKLTFQYAETGNQDTLEENYCTLEELPLLPAMLSVIPAFTFVKLMKEYRIPPRAYYCMLGLSGIIKGKGFNDIKRNPYLKLSGKGKLYPAGKYQEALIQAYMDALKGR